MVSFKLFAGTNVGLRDNNEDNFTLCPDLTRNQWTMPADHQQTMELGERGCLMVVADGMGGQNAGEVASAIAIDTVQKMFAPECLTDPMLAKPSAIKAYLKKVVTEADLNVKEYSKSHPEAEGLGSTIVMAWVIGCKAYVAWLGDSRAYGMVPGQGIRRLSKDHSYVQRLVDAGALTDIEAMNHPNSNVITRSLGDMSQKAKADVEEYALEDDEIILLCSDGLCGVCTDDEIADVIKGTSGDLQECKERLMEAALDNGGSDNITIALMHMFIDGEKPAIPRSLRVKRTMWGALSAGVVLLGVLAWKGTCKDENSCTPAKPSISTPQDITPQDSTGKDSTGKSRKGSTKNSGSAEQAAPKTGDNISQIIETIKQKNGVDTTLSPGTRAGATTNIDR